MGAVTKPRFFRSRAEWRTWLEKNHATAKEIVVGFHKKATGRPTIAYQEALDEALCFGWIDGVRRGGESSWTIRFTPRKPRSAWSAVNTRRMEVLKKAGFVAPAGLAAYEARDPQMATRYPSENRDVRLSPEFEKRFKTNRTAWTNFESMAPSYRRLAIWWVMSAKKDETRERRLATLIEDSEAGRRVVPLRRPGKRK